MSLIGVFDSGVGGLTVLKSLVKKYPEHDFIYLADTARLPYGTKSSATIKNYLNRNIDFLKSHKVDFVVVACNSASTVMIGEESPFDLPVFNVIEPGSLAAAKVSSEKKIGVLGTRTTVLSKAYVNAIHQHDNEIQVYQMAAPLLVPLVEEGWVDDPLTNMVIYRYTKPLLDQGIDTLILGCTHYPVLETSFRKVVGPNIHLVDSPDSLSSKLDQEFPHLNQVKEEKKGLIRIYCTDLTPHLEQLIQYLISPLAAQPIQKVDL